ncbi:MAG: hypothetical protein ACRC92_26060 [Peptostreptococcaceae bacterium]
MTTELQELLVETMNLHVINGQIHSLLQGATIMLTEAEGGVGEKIKGLVMKVIDYIKKFMRGVMNIFRNIFRLNRKNTAPVNFGSISKSQHVNSTRMEGLNSAIVDIKRYYKEVDAVIQNSKVKVYTGFRTKTQEEIKQAITTAFEGDLSRLILDKKPLDAIIDSLVNSILTSLKLVVSSNKSTRNGINPNELKVLKASIKVGLYNMRKSVYGSVESITDVNDIWYSVSKSVIDNGFPIINDAHPIGDYIKDIKDEIVAPVIAVVEGIKDASIRVAYSSKYYRVEGIKGTSLTPVLQMSMTPENLAKSYEFMNDIVKSKIIRVDLDKVDFNFDNKEVPKGIENLANVLMVNMLEDVQPRELEDLVKVLDEYSDKIDELSREINSAQNIDKAMLEALTSTQNIISTITNLTVCGQMYKWTYNIFHNTCKATALFTVFSAVFANIQHMENTEPIESEGQDTENNE